MGLEKIANFLREKKSKLAIFLFSKEDELQSNLLDAGLEGVKLTDTIEEQEERILLQYIQDNLLKIYREEKDSKMYERVPLAIVQGEGNNILLFLGYYREHSSSEKTFGFFTHIKFGRIYDGDYENNDPQRYPIMHPELGDVSLRRDQLDIVGVRKLVQSLGIKERKKIKDAFENYKKFKIS